MPEPRASGEGDLVYREALPHRGGEAVDNEEGGLDLRLRQEQGEVRGVCVTRRGRRERLLWSSRQHISHLRVFRTSTLLDSSGPPRIPSGDCQSSSDTPGRSM